MKSRILSIVLAISMIAVLFAALPTRGAVYYTGTVITTDTSGIPKTDFIQGEQVYVNVTTLTDGVLATEQVNVALVRTNDAHQVSSFTTNTNNPVVGVYNSTIAASHLSLSTSHAITGDVQSYNVIVTLPLHGGVMIAEVQIVVRATGLHLTPEPNNPAYWPGQVITANLVITKAETAEVFYVQIVNETGAQTTLNYTGQTALTGYWTKQFTIAPTLPDGLYFMNVRATSDNAIWYSVFFQVLAFDLIVDSDRSYFLPGETAKISYVVRDLATLSQVSSGLTVTYSAEYANKTGNTTWKNGTLPINQNLWNFVLPTNGTAADSIALYSNIDITITAKQPTTNRTVEHTVFLYIGLLSASVDMADHFLVPGDTAAVTVSASVLGSPLPGAQAVVTVWRNGTELVATYGNGNLTTDQSGQASYTFVVASTAPIGNYIVKATIKKVGYEVQRETQFEVSDDMGLAIEWNKLYYYGGESATVYFEPVFNGQVATVTSIGYVISIQGQVLVAANTTAMSATITIPDGYSGWIEANAFTHINGVLVENSAFADVVFAELGLTPAASSYRPGDTIEFEWSIVTSLSTATLTWEIKDDKGVRVASGSPAFAKTGSFEFTVPEANPLLSQSYFAQMWMTTSTGSYRSASASVDIVAVQELLVWIGDSPYTSGDFAPGQKIKIHYQIDANVFEVVPLMRLHVSVTFDPVEFDFVTDTAAGEITYTIPKDAPMGQIYVMVAAYDAATGATISSDFTSFMVNNRVSGWDRSIGGMSAIDFTLLVLLIIVIVMLIVVPLLKGRMGAPKPPEPAPPAEVGKVPPP